MPRFNRRTILKAGAATGVVLAAPAILRAHDALASSGSVNVFAWGDYFDKNTILEDFTSQTGIEVNLSTYGANAEAENKLRAAGGSGFDLLFPSVDTGPNYYKDDLLQPIDEAKFNADNVIPAIYRNSLTLGAADRGTRYLVPFDWGTEAVTWDSSAHDLTAGELSYGDMWAEGMDGQAACRQFSVYAGVALYLDAIGEVPSDRAMAMYASEEESRRVFDACLKFLSERKANIGAFWSNATEATAAFTDSGCTIGQTWDTTGILLGRDVDPKWKYAMPKEGGLAWTDTLAIPAGAANLDQAYEFANYLFTPEVGGSFANATGYNSCAVGAEEHLSDEAKAAFAAAYPEGTIDNLWWWPMQPAFYAELRSEYTEKLANL